MKAGDFFGETSNRTFVTRGLIVPIVSEGQICRLDSKIRSASIFGKSSAARKFGGFCFLKFSAV